MRLTLRTMLAYLDHVLDPADGEALGKKIEESDFASGLVHRIKGVVRKLRMDAPKLDGKGMGNDANTVAEYLDSSLPQDRVGEFERVCLESDKHLCEVASCHQILALVLGKAADVPPNLRERIYELGDPERLAAKAAGEQAAAPVPPPAPNPNGQPATHPAPLEVPEYLRAGRNTSVWPFIGLTAAALLLALIGLRAMGPFDRTHPLARAFAPKATETPSGDEQNSAPTTPESSNSNSASTITAPDATAKTTDATPATSDVAAANEQPAAAATDAAAPPAAVDRPATESPDKVAAATPMPIPTIPVLPDAPEATLATPPAVVVANTPKLPGTKPPPPPRPAPIEVGRYTADNQLMATLDLEDGLWYAKQPQEILVAGEQLVALPAYRPQMSLPSAVQLKFAGEGSVQMAEPGADRTPRVIIEYGRFVAATAGKAGAQVELDLCGIKGVLTLVDADSVLAIKAARWAPPGADPEAVAGIPVVEIYNVSGRSSWQRPEQAKVDIPVHSVHVQVGDVPPETHGPYYPPEWIDAKNTPPIDRDAAMSLERLIVDIGRPLNLSLQEATKDRRVEVRALTARCLATLGDFEPIIRELSDYRQYSFWPGEFETLRHIIGRSPETAARLRETLSLVRASDAKDLYRLLCSYSDDQLSAGASAQLVRFLKSEQMDIRALAYLNLVSITGVVGFYRPEKPPAQMKTSIQNWDDRQTKGTIIHRPDRPPPSPLDTYKPMAGVAPTAAPAAGAK